MQLHLQWSLNIQHSANFARRQPLHCCLPEETGDLFTNEKGALSLAAFTRGRVSVARLVPVQVHTLPRPSAGKAFIRRQRHPSGRLRIES